MLFRKKKRQEPETVSDSAGRTETPATSRRDEPGISGEVVAAITAALAAASGVSAQSIRIAAISPSQGYGAGINTPVWGMVERLRRE